MYYTAKCPAHLVVLKGKKANSSIPVLFWGKTSGKNSRCHATAMFVIQCVFNSNTKHLDISHLQHCNRTLQISTSNRYRPYNVCQTTKDGFFLFHGQEEALQTFIAFQRP